MSNEALTFIILPFCAAVMIYDLYVDVIRS